MDIVNTPVVQRRPGLVLAVACLAAFAINLDGTIVNVALPSLARQLRAGTSDLQWVVDGYSLAFAALVLTAGSLGDRFGRRPALITGLVGFAATSAVGALVHTVQQLVVARVFMGAFAALIFPTTLSVINSAFPDREKRRAAIGVWGAVTGIGVAVGPVSGGLLLSHFAWPSVFAALVPVALLAAAMAFLVVPESSDPAGARLDVPGLLLASATVGSLVFTIIEAPGWGWGSARALAGFTGAAVLAAVFVAVERRREQPMIDVSLFKNPAFSAASGSVTLAFFALFGFIFIVTQYMQFVRGWGALSTGVRILPVATTIAAGSVGGSIAAARFGTRAVVVSGLVLFGVSFAWIATAPTFMSYTVIVGQMVCMGLGLGLTSTPATESILSVLPPAKTGVGSAVNDATREAGGCLGVAIVGSVFTTLFARHLASTSFASLPGQVAGAAGHSVGMAAGLSAAHPALRAGFDASFTHGMHVACAVVAVVCWVGAVGALALPGRRALADASAAAPALAVA